MTQTLKGAYRGLLGTSRKPLILLCRGRDSNPHGPCEPEDFKFLHRCRRFLLQNERTNFYKVCNKLAKQLDHPYFRGLLNTYRKRYSGEHLQSAFQIVHDGVLINSEKILLNGLMRMSITKK